MEQGAMHGERWLPEGDGGDRADAPAPDLGRLVELIDQTYQAVDAAARLRPLLESVADAIGVGSILLVSHAGGERRLVADGHVHPRESSAALRIAVGERERAGRTRTVPLGGGLELVLDRAELGVAEQRLFQRLIPHLARAMRLAERLAAAERRVLHAGSLEHLGIAVALLDERARLLVTNRVARRLLAPGSPLVVNDGRLAPRHPVSRALLETLIERVATPSSPGRERSGGRVRLKAGNGPDIDLLVVRFDGRVDGAAASCAVLLAAPGVAPAVEEHLERSHGLDPREALAAARLLEGCPPGSGWAGTEEEVEPVLRRLYEKTGSTRQRDLLWLLLQPARPVFRAASGDLAR